MTTTRSDNGQTTEIGVARRERRLGIETARLPAMGLRRVVGDYRMAAAAVPTAERLA